MNWKEFLRLSLKNNTIRFIIAWYVVLFSLFFISLKFEIYFILVFVFFILSFGGYCILYGGGLNFNNWIKELTKFTENSLKRKIILFFLGFMFVIVGGYYTGVFLIGLPLGFLGLTIIDNILKSSIKSKIKLMFLSSLIVLIFLISIIIGALPLTGIGG